QEAAPREARDQRPSHEQRAEHEHAGLVRGHGGRVPDVRVTVLGKSPSWQDAGGACSGYLVEDGETALLLDCGNGVFAKLRRYREVPHFAQTCAVELRSTNGGGRFVYGADSAPTEKLVDFADGADLLMVEGTLPRPEREGPRGHLTPAEAGEHAARARAGRVVITHISDELGDDWARAEAERGYGGTVEVAG